MFAPPLCSPASSSAVTATSPSTTCNTLVPFSSSSHPHPPPLIPLPRPSATRARMKGLSHAINLEVSRSGQGPASAGASTTDAASIFATTISSLTGSLSRTSHGCQTAAPSELSKGPAGSDTATATPGDAQVTGAYVSDVAVGAGGVLASSLPPIAGVAAHGAAKGMSGGYHGRPQADEVQQGAGLHLGLSSPTSLTPEGCIPYNIPPIMLTHAPGVTAAASTGKGSSLLMAMRDAPGMSKDEQSNTCLPLFGNTPIEKRGSWKQMKQAGSCCDENTATCEQQQQQPGTMAQPAAVQIDARSSTPVHTLYQAAPSTTAEAPAADSAVAAHAASVQLQQAWPTDLASASAAAASTTAVPLSSAAISPSTSVLDFLNQLHNQHWQKQQQQHREQQQQHWEQEQLVQSSLPAISPIPAAATPSSRALTTAAMAHLISKVDPSDIAMLAQLLTTSPPSQSQSCSLADMLTACAYSPTANLAGGGSTAAQKTSDLTGQAAPVALVGADGGVTDMVASEKARSTIPTSSSFTRASHAAKASHFGTVMASSNNSGRPAGGQLEGYNAALVLPGGVGASTTEVIPPQRQAKQRQPVDMEGLLQESESRQVEPQLVGVTALHGSMLQVATKEDHQQRGQEQEGQQQQQLLQVLVHCEEEARKGRRVVRSRKEGLEAPTSDTLTRVAAETDKPGRKANVGVIACGGRGGQEGGTRGRDGNDAGREGKRRRLVASESAGREKGERMAATGGRQSHSMCDDISSENNLEMELADCSNQSPKQNLRQQGEKEGEGPSMRPRSVAERKRRGKISTRLEELKSTLPIWNPRMDTATMLDETVRYIALLQQQVQQLQEENQALRDTNRRDGANE